MVEKLVFEEIMSQEAYEKQVLVLALELMTRYCDEIELKMDDKYNVYYKVNADTFLMNNKNIELNELLTLNQYGWKLNADKKFLVYFLN